MPSRRGRRVAGLTLAAVLAATALVSAAGATQGGIDRNVIELYSDGLVVTPQGVATVAPGTRQAYLPGVRVPAVSGVDAAGRAELDRLASKQRAWLDAGTIPGVGTRFEDMARGALGDLHALLGDDGAVPAALHERWGYAWPRDNAFVAAALARTGHGADAVRVLDFLARVQADDGSFEARYTLDGAGPPDGRHPQTDGTGWVLWALGEVLDATQEGPATTPAVTSSDAAPTRTDVALSLRGLLERATDHAIALTEGGRRLPPASPDYWEVRESVTTLGTAAPLLAGLEAATDAWTLLGEPERARTTADAAATLRERIESTFGTLGYPRHVTGGARDAATAFVLPPFVTVPLDGAEAAWRASVGPMLRPAGGLAPGGSWRPDGVSWTPQTTLYALTAASLGDRTTAEHWLGWIDKHRTSSGAIPEKVLADGSPAAVAPLAWSSANVLLALTALQDAP
ncbi:glycoside hydrolase family 15 [Sanguibacter sp. A247]|uniref:glycoside hydrolase family 15 n=1 Tax=unclassified Sanguibacter TaxID=2645534 RepID=UPI003FD6EE5F